VIFTVVNFYAQEQGLNSQNEGAKAFKINGSLNLSSEFYNANGLAERFPGNTERLILRTNITLFDQIQLPFELSLSTQQAKFQQPFNQIGVNPQLTDWLTLHAGYFSTQLSDFSFGDVRILGGGIELKPGNFRFKALYGQSKDASDADTSQFFFGRYSQTVYALQIGYGDEMRNFFNLNIFHAIDDSTSIKQNSLVPRANENFVTSVNFGFKPAESLVVNGEVAGSLFSHDITAEDLSDDKFKMPSFLFTLKSSSQVDGAARLFAVFTPNRYWNLKLGARWVGPGFITLGYSQLTNDFVEYTAVPTVSLLDRKLNLRGSIGIRYNNLRENKITTTGRYTGAFSADYQITNQFGFNLQFNNNQVKASRNNDTLKISNVFNSLSLSPRYNFQGLGGANNISLTYSYQNSEDKLPYQMTTVQNTTNTINLLHSIFLPSTLNFITFIMHNSVEIPGMTIRMFNITETASYNFFENRLSTSLSLGYSSTETTSTSDAILVRVSAGYSIGEFGRFSLNLSNNSINSNDKYNPSYSELQGVLQYEINF